MYWRDTSESTISRLLELYSCLHLPDDLMKLPCAPKARELLSGISFFGYSSYEQEDGLDANFLLSAPRPASDGAD
ncbi:unnamed protein product [Dibothriocephalus latus]|uniref:Uncharacterized protein n=1 Tax=Dibothriocephalus latus TaxID=60516 RepID=A0A3P7L0M7_DIBLA|nr:unnamed protein product [Dibothriocephalus latus]